MRVEPQAFDVLCYLVEHRGEVVRKEQLLDDVWGDRFVSESALTTRIKSVRQAVGDDGSRQAIIRTVHGKGYEFIATVETVERASSWRGTVPSRHRAAGVRDAATDRPRDAPRAPRRRSSSTAWSPSSAPGVSGRRRSAWSWPAASPTAIPTG